MAGPDSRGNPSTSRGDVEIYDATIVHERSRRRWSPWILWGGLGAAVLLSGLAVLVLSAQQHAITPARKIEKRKTEKKQAYEVFAAAKDLYCPTDPDFLDSSPLVSPARFAHVPKGTEVVIVHMGGILSGKSYYGLSAGGTMRVYVYRDEFDQTFQKTRTIEK